MTNKEWDKLIKQHPWILFYMEFADKLRQFKSDRRALIKFIHHDQKQSDHFNYLRDRDSNGNKCNLEDICPFTTIGTFNRGILGKTAKIETKQEIAKKFASFLGIKTPVPGSFDGIPTLDNQKSWFFGFANDRQPDDIDNLWKIFDEAIEYADVQKNADNFMTAFKTALDIKNTGPRYLPIGLFWIRPASFLSLDQKSAKYISDNANGLSVGKKLTAERYLNTVQELKTRFQENRFPVASFPELALRAVDGNSQTTQSTNNTTNSIKTMSTNKLHSLNQILYGPPGTGKTYNAISLAVAIAMGQDWTFWNTKEQEVEKFNKFRTLKESGQIQMVTFHQNYAYEDFIEGIKPQINHADENKNLFYEIEDGIFKSMVKHASVNSTTGISGQQKAINARELLDDFADEIEQQLAADEKVYLDINQENKATVIDLIYKSNGDLQGIKYVAGKSNRYLRADLIIRDYEDFENGKIAKPKDIRRENSADNLSHRNSSYYFLIYQKIREFKSRSEKPYTSIEEKNYVLIIDEINRGNISKIFGELITLIEDTKREGEPEGLKLTLPYSKEEFGVPNNLYIIGTMNTADRSIALLDTALRRRFKFTEMMPDITLLSSIEQDAISLPDLLTAINQRITALHDREHQIGHSYLMKVKDIAGLKNAFQQNIIPLLQEYFFDDREKIKDVLNSNGFIDGTTNEVLHDKDPKWDHSSSYVAIYKNVTPQK